MSVIVQHHRGNVEPNFLRDEFENNVAHITTTQEQISYIELVMPLIVERSPNLWTGNPFVKVLY